MTVSPTSLTRTYDLVGFGDEVPGILALVAAAREFNRRTGRRLRTLLMLKGQAQEGVGGHLVRGGLSYLDRSTVPLDVRLAYGLPTFGDPSRLYLEFLRRSDVQDIGLDPRKANTALRSMLSEIGADILSRAQIKSVIKQGDRLAGIELTRGETYLARQFIDASVNAELAQFAGVPKYQGFGTFGLPESELPVTLTFETEGLSVQQLQATELAYIRRFTNPKDLEAQQYLAIATGSNQKQAEQFRQGMVDSRGNPRTMYVAPDHIDVLCRALCVAYHSYRGKKFNLAESGYVFDQPNIALLPGGRLSWNAFLIYTSGSQAEVLARGAARPSAAMLEEFKFVERWIRSLGARVVRPAPELYIRHAGNVAQVVQPISGAEMLSGGVPAEEAFGSFSYYLDVRGGITGLGPKALEKGFSSISFHSIAIFNIGMQHALIRTVPNLAVISPASGFDGYASGAGRIIEFNAGVGQGVGIAAALALLSNRNLATISNREVNQVLLQTGQLPCIYGRPDPVEAARLKEFELAMAAGVAIA
ncbi:MAG: FAD-dependent oxidoreductase [Leptolyngbyaceae cyanobacterium]